MEQNPPSWSGLLPGPQSPQSFPRILVHLCRHSISPSLAPSFQFLGSPVLRSGALLVCVLDGSEAKASRQGKVSQGCRGCRASGPPPRRPLHCCSLPCPLASGGWCVLTVWQVGIHRECSGEREPDSGLRQEGDWKALLLTQLGSGERSLSGTWHFQPSFSATCVTWGNTSQNAELPVVGHGVVVTMGGTDPIRALGGVGGGVDMNARGSR